MAAVAIHLPNASPMILRLRRQERDGQEQRHARGAPNHG
jgi:hypothetical protein